MLYQKVIRPIFFKTDPEKIHHFVINVLSVVSHIKPIYSFIRHFLNVSDPILKTQIGNVKLENPIGLAAGFDKNITAPLAYPMLGFGSAELGSVTFKSQAGNPKPRLWRLPKDKGLIVYYGLSNHGAPAAAQKMKKLNNHPIPFGISIAPTNDLLPIDLADDYARSFEKVLPYADFITLNVSCPNVVGFDLFAQVSFIKELIEKISNLKKQLKSSTDIYIKISPDMTDQQYDEIVDACITNNITAIVATNLVKNRSTISPQSSVEELNHPGGISGKMVGDKSNEVIRKLYKRASGRLQIIGLGGVFTAQDAYDKIKSGASVIQLVTGFIYGGPTTILNINKGLAELLRKDGFENISQAVGKDV